MSGSKFYLGIFLVVSPAPTSYIFTTLLISIVFLELLEGSWTPILLTGSLLLESLRRLFILEVKLFDSLSRSVLEAK